MSVPFHKQLDPNKQAGQIVNPVPEQLLHQSHKQETTLAQYIERKTGAITDCDIPKKITFDEFLLSYAKRDDGTYPHGFDPKRPRDFMYMGTTAHLLEHIWNAALTKGKI